MPEVFPPKTLGDMESVRSWLPCLIHPGLSVETLGINHQCVALPLACGITKPCGNEILCQLTAVEEDLPPQVRSFVDDHHGSRCLDQLPRWRRRIDPWHALGQAVRSRVLSGMRSVCSLIDERLGPGQIWDITGL